MLFGHNLLSCRSSLGVWQSDPTGWLHSVRWAWLNTNPSWKCLTYYPVLPNTLGFGVLIFYSPITLCNYVLPNACYFLCVEWSEFDFSDFSLVNCRSHSFLMHRLKLRNFSSSNCTSTMKFTMCAVGKKVLKGLRISTKFSGCICFLLFCLFFGFFGNWSCLRSLFFKIRSERATYKLSICIISL